MEKKENYQASLPTIFSSLHEYYSLDDSHCHNHLHSQMVNDEALMVPQKEEQELSDKCAKEVVQGMFLDENLENSQANEGKRKRKRPRIKTNEEVETQRMTHIAVERNRRKQMNEHLRVLRSLMPGSYVQRGDQASIVGGAIEFVRELEQLLQCLESQKRRRLNGDDPIRQPIKEDSSTSSLMAIQNSNPQPPFFAPSSIEYEAYDSKTKSETTRRLAERLSTEIQEETAEIKSHLADVEVKLQGFDNATIKILSKRRPGQLINTISALEDLQLNILHTNITTIEQTVLYSFNVKISGETRYTADNIANLVQQIFNFIHVNSPI